MEDRNEIDSLMDGQPFKAGHHAATLRRFLWREHLGLLPAQEIGAENDPNAQPPNDCPNDIKEGKEYDFVQDPLSDDLWNLWTENATKNTEQFRYLFRADPDDHSKSFFISIITYLSTCTHISGTNRTTVTTFEEYEQFLPKTGVKQGHLYDPFMPAEEVRQKLDQIKGHLVWMPMHFLEKAEMAEKGVQVNSITESVYT
jgi:phospholipase D1/2